MNDDLVVQKISKLLQNNTAFIGYALNGGIGTKINVRNTETGKTIQALSINVDSTGEVLVVKDSADNQYKAVNFKTSEKVSSKIIQLRKTKPVDDKKEIEYTDSDIEVFYLFVKLIDTGSPVPSQLTSTWIRKGSSCTQFVGAYERCNYASKETIGGVSYTGLPYVPYPSLNECLTDDLGRDAKTPHGSKDENGGNAAWKYFSTKVNSSGEASMKAALESHDAEYNTSYKKIFGYGSILECSGAMNLQGWELSQSSKNPGQYFFRCEFSYLPGYTNACTPAMQAAGYCDTRGFISSKCPQFGQELPGQPSIGSIDSTWNVEYGWKDLPYEFMYKRHFGQLYLNGSSAPGSFYILEVNDDQVPGNLPDGYFPWVPGCPSGGQGGPYDGSGGNRFPDGVPPIKKRDMKLSTHKAEIWLGSSKKEEAIKLYELGLSDLFSGMYNAFILPSEETAVDVENRLNRGFANTEEELIVNTNYYQHYNKNIIDLKIDPRVWVYIINNTPTMNYIRQSLIDVISNPRNETLQLMIDNLYNRTINLTILDKKIQIVHLKLGLIPKNILSNTDCKGVGTGNFPVSTNDLTPGQSWEYQKYVTIKIKDWKIESTSNTLDTTLLSTTIWNKNYIERKFFTSFGNSTTRFASAGILDYALPRDSPTNIVLRSNNSILLSDLSSGNHYEQYNYTQAKTSIISSSESITTQEFPNSRSLIKKPTNFNENERFVMRSTSNWWALWDRSTLDSNNRLSSIVGYDLNFHQVLTGFGLNPSLNYEISSGGSLKQQVNENSYWEYLPNRPKLLIPSNIKSARTKVIPTSSYLNLTNRENTLNIYGLNYYYTHITTGWSGTVVYGRSDNLNTFPIAASSYYSTNTIPSKTRENALISLSSTGTFSSSKRFDTRQWINRLWAQFVFDGFINVDLDSYKNVKFTPPTNPTQYIKYVITQDRANSEFNFVLSKEQTLETVLSPGTLDITKQVKITKPTNVDLDPNFSFLLYIYPNVEVTKKKKTI